MVVADWDLGGDPERWHEGERLGPVGAGRPIGGSFDVIREADRRQPAGPRMTAWEAGLLGRLREMGFLHRMGNSRNPPIAGR